MNEIYILYENVEDIESLLRPAFIGIYKTPEGLLEGAKEHFYDYDFCDDIYKEKEVFEFAPGEEKWVGYFNQRKPHNFYKIYNYLICKLEDLK